MKLLTGHTSPETAYLVTDYPYGFRLRCQIRYWIEWTKHGARFCSQTTNPKKPGVYWNQPKKDTYRDLGAMYLDDKDHVCFHGISLEWADQSEWDKWLSKFSEALPDLPQVKAILNNAVIIFEARKHIRVEIMPSETLDLSALMRRDPEAVAKADRIAKEQEERKREKERTTRLVIAHAQSVTGLKLI